MMQYAEWEIGKKYIKKHMGAGLFYMGMILIFVCISLLGQAEQMVNLWYAGLLTFLLLVLAGILDYRKYRRRFLLLLEMKENMPEIPRYLEAGEQVFSEEETAVLESLWKEMTLQVSRYDEKEHERKDYYSMWAHQIKTPIAALKLLIQGEADKKRSSAQLEELFKIEQYVEMVLHYLRLEDMANDLLLKEYDLRALTAQAVRKNRTLFINSHLSFSLEDFSCTVITDEKWLVFVLEQLITNAIKYTPEGGISVYMDPEQEKVLVIEDTGIGIREEDLPRIFDKGFTGYNGRMDKKSTGIGLYLAKQILDRLGHKIRVESEFLKGTRVRIDFGVWMAEPEDFSYLTKM